MIKAWLSRVVAPYEAEILVALVIGLIGFCMWEVHHQRAIGAARVVAADAEARAQVHAGVLKDEAKLQARADKAERERDAITKTLNDYAAAHPVGSVRLCKPGAGSAGMPKTGSGTGPANTGSGSTPVPEVLGGGEGVDIGPDVDAILSAAEAVDGLYQSRQRGN